jgi:hypothetical protein
MSERRLQKTTFLPRLARLMVSLVLLVLTSIFAPGQQTERVPLPFERGEELVYSGEFTRGLLRGVDVAEFRFKAEPEHIARGTDDVVVLRLTGDVVSKGLFTRIAGFKFHQHVESKADVEPLRVLRTDKIEESNKRRRVLDAEYDHEKRKVIWREISPNPQGGTFDFSEPIQDVLTVIYYLRTQKLEVGKSFVAPDLVILRRIVLPATLPYIMAGVRLAVGRAVVAMVIAEFFTTISGLGAVIINSANNFDTATMFVPIIILMLMAVGLNWLIGWVERRVAPWQAEIAGRDRE